eukprot:gene28666-35564_t
MNDSPDKNGRPKHYVARPRLNKLPAGTVTGKGGVPVTSEPVVEPLYHIKMVFEAPTKYLAIPIELFEKILDDDRMILPRISKEVRGQLSHANQSILDRITKITPWILGHQDFVSKADPHRTKPLPVVTESSGDGWFDDYNTAEQANETSTAPQGSFLRHTIHINPLPSPRDDSSFSVYSHITDNTSRREKRDQERLMLSKSLTSLPSLVGSAKPLPMSTNNSANNSVHSGVNSKNSRTGTSTSVHSRNNVKSLAIDTGRSGVTSGGNLSGGGVSVPDVIQFPLSVSIKGSYGGGGLNTNSTPNSRSSTSGGGVAAVQDNGLYQMNAMMMPSRLNPLRVDTRSSTEFTPAQIAVIASQLPSAVFFTDSVETLPNTPALTPQLGAPIIAVDERSYPAYRGASFDSSVESKIRDSISNTFADEKLFARLGSFSSNKTGPLIRADVDFKPVSIIGTPGKNKKGRKNVKMAVNFGGDDTNEDTTDEGGGATNGTASKMRFAEPAVMMVESSHEDEEED